MDDRFSLCNMAIEAGAKMVSLHTMKFTKEFLDSRESLRAEPKFTIQMKMLFIVKRSLLMLKNLNL